jgi:hypothetical protein
MGHGDVLSSGSLSTLDCPSLPKESNVSVRLPSPAHLSSPRSVDVFPLRSAVCSESPPKSTPKKPRLNSSADTIDTVLKSGCLVESIKVHCDFDCEFVDSRPADLFHLALIFPLSQDVKLQLALSNEILDVRMLLLVSNTTNVSQTE